MAGSVKVRYAKKTYRQIQSEEVGYAQMNKQLNHSIEIVPGSEVVRYYENMKDAHNFAKSVHDQGHNVLEIKNEYK